MIQHRLVDLGVCQCLHAPYAVGQDRDGLALAICTASCASDDVERRQVRGLEAKAAQLLDPLDLKLGLSTEPLLVHRHRRSPYRSAPMLLLPAPMLSKFLEKGKGAVCCATDSWGADFYEIGPEKGEQVVEKRCYSAFHNTQMDDILRRRDIKSLVMTGVATNVCVESTLREAFFHGYYIVMPPDCVGSANVPLHEATIKSVEFIFGHVPESGQVMDVWLGKARAGQAAE